MFTALVECILTGLVAGGVVVLAARLHIIPLLVMWEDEGKPDETP